ncbi:superkiller complex protein 2 [Synchiropus picturatus]
MEGKNDPPPDTMDLPLSLLEMGCSGRFELITHPLPGNAPAPQSTLPHGLPPTALNLEAEVEKQFLQDPGWLPLYDTDFGFRKFLEVSNRNVNVDSLLNCTTSPLHSELSVLRDPTTGMLLDITEVLLENTGLSAKNSLSLQRKPGPPSDGHLGSSTNYPFLPGGMEELTLDQIQKKSDLETDIDFEKDLLNVPPGFKVGMDFTDKDAKLVKEPVSLMTILSTLDINDLQPEAPEKDTGSDGSLKLPRTNSLDDLGIQDSASPASTSQEAKEEKKSAQPEKPQEEVKKWAIPVDVTSPCEDFHKRIPHPAFTWPFELDVFQKQAVLRLEAHESIFVAAHTSAGKTVVAEYAIALSQKHMTRTIYTSPIKALSNQKYRDFKNTFGDVGLLTGDIRLNPESSCLIMTTEILRSMLYNGSDVIRDLEWVVFDEVHYINDAERGVVWEEVLIMLPDHVGIIFLSATVPNALEFSEWIGRIKKKQIYVISTSKRPVPLEHFLYTGNSTKTEKEKFLLLDAEGKFLNKGHSAAVDAIKSRASKHSQTFGAKGTPRYTSASQDRSVWLTLLNYLSKQHMTPVIAFIFSRSRCDDNAAGLNALDLTTSTEKSKIHSFFKKSLSCLQAGDQQLPQILRVKDYLVRGIAVHHSGILPILKEVVEMLFSRGLVKVLFATETFAMGVNMPARTVVFDSLRKHDGTGFRNLLPGEYIQMAGRAGRRGLDATGTVLILCKSGVQEFSELHQMMLGKPTVLHSQFRLTYNMILNLLRVENLRVTDMMRRSFSESHKDNQANETRIKTLKQTLSTLPPLETHGQMSDILSYYMIVTEMKDISDLLQGAILESTSGLKALSVGRVVVVNNSQHFNALGVIVQVSVDLVSSAFTTLIICEKGNENGGMTARVDIPFHHYFNTALFVPEGPCSHTVQKLKMQDISAITVKTLKVVPDRITNDFNKRQLPRFKLDPPGEAISRTTQELLRMAEANPGGLATLDPINDLKLNRVEVVEGSLRLRGLQERLKDFNCVHSPTFAEQFEVVKERMSVQTELDQLRFLMSDQALTLLPEYNQRIEVLKSLQYVDSSGALQLKGRVACLLSNHELLLTELLLENVLSPLASEECAALLSCLVFTQNTQVEPTVNKALKEAIDRVQAVAWRIGELQAEHGVIKAVSDFVQDIKFGLAEVVYCWARGMPFTEIIKLTDIQEGTVVRCIQRLDEVLKEVKQAAHIVGDSVLEKKMENASLAIRRDIIFTASLYTH